MGHLTEHQSLLSIVTTTIETQYSLCETFPLVCTSLHRFTIPSSPTISVTFLLLLHLAKLQKLQLQDACTPLNLSGATASSNLICFQAPSYSSQISASNPCFNTASLFGWRVAVLFTGRLRVIQQRLGILGLLGCRRGPPWPNQQCDIVNAPLQERG
jgi:hypothetical protein